VRERADHYDGELLLRLYELRREEKLRQARDWFAREFQAKSLEEFGKLCPPGSEPNCYFRMTVSYWDMAASMVNNGLIKEEFFFESTTEFWLVWEKLKQMAPAVREAYANPTMFKNLETLAGKYEKWMAKRAPEALAAFRRRMQEAAAKKTA
jgi:hypothetical protein